jgi:hypothetical protein
MKEKFNYLQFFRLLSIGFGIASIGIAVAAIMYLITAGK